MTKPVTGQYEFARSSGVGLDYFTSRIDRLVLQPDGRFVLTIQDRSRLSQAAQALANGQQVTATAPETRREGKYTAQGEVVSLFFDEGGYEPGKVIGDGEGIQLGPNFFKKISDSTLLPPTERLKKDMDDIAKGIKIATTLGGIAIKAVKTIQGSVQQSTPAGTTLPNQAPPAQSTASTPAAPPPVQPPAQATSTTPPPAPPASPQTIQESTRAIFCDQCGARCRPGKRFCNNCGARLA